MSSNWIEDMALQNDEDSPEEQAAYEFDRLTILVTNHPLFPLYRKAMGSDTKLDPLGEWIVAAIATDSHVTVEQVLAVAAADAKESAKYVAEARAAYVKEYGEPYAEEREYGNGEPHAKFNAEELRDAGDDEGEEIPVMKLEPWG